MSLRPDLTQQRNGRVGLAATLMLKALVLTRVGMPLAQFGPAAIACMHRKGARRTEGWPLLPGESLLAGTFGSVSGFAPWLS